MKDIRPILRQRLEDIQAARLALKLQCDASLQALTRRESKLMAFLEEEEAAMSRELAFPFFEDITKTVPEPPLLRELVIRALKNKQPQSLDTLKDIANTEKWPVAESSPGRSINFALVGLQRNGEADRNPDTGEWSLLLKKMEDFLDNKSQEVDVPPEDTDGTP